MRDSAEKEVRRLVGTSKKRCRQNREMTACGVFMWAAVAGIKSFVKSQKKTFKGYLEVMGPSVIGLQGEEKSLSLVTSCKEITIHTHSLLKTFKSGFIAYLFWVNSQCRYLHWKSWVLSLSNNDTKNITELQVYSVVCVCVCLFD